MCSQGRASCHGHGSVCLGECRKALPLSPKEVFEMVAKPKRFLLQGWFDELFSSLDLVQTLAAKTSLLSETHPSARV